MNYFDIFEINMKFELGEKILQDKYIQLQKKYHPDMAKNEEEKNKFIVMAADLNQAYSTLKNPYKRAAYILKLQNIDVEKEGRDAYKLPPELLSSILEKREELEEIEGYDNLLAFKKLAVKEREGIIGELAKRHHEGDEVDRRDLRSLSVKTSRDSYGKQGLPRNDVTRQDLMGSRRQASMARDDIIITLSILLKYQDNLIEAINHKLEKCF